MRKTVATARASIGALISPQMDILIRKFGSQRALASALQVVAPDYPEISASFNAVSRWRWPYRCHAGNGGQVPSYCLRALLHAARLHGVVLTHDDLLPTHLIPFRPLPTGRPARKVKGPAKKRRTARAKSGKYDDWEASHD